MKQNKTIAKITGMFNNAFNGYSMTDEFIVESLHEKFLANLKTPRVIQAMDMAIVKYKPIFNSKTNDDDRKTL